MQRHNFVSNLIYGYNLYTTITQTIFHLRENSMRESAYQATQLMAPLYHLHTQHAPAFAPTTITLLLGGAAASHMDEIKNDYSDGEWQL